MKGMKRKYAIYIFQWIGFSLFQLPSSFCQTSKIDSLTSVIKAAKDDTIKVITFNHLFSQLEFTDTNKARECLKEALELALKADYKKGIAATYINLGFLAEDKGNYPEALKNYVYSLEVKESIRLPNGDMADKNGVADSYLAIGNIFYYQGIYSEVLKNYFAALKIYESINNKLGIANTFDNIGCVYYDQGNYRQSLKNHLASIKLFEEIGNRKGVAYAYNNVANNYYMLGNSMKAIEYHKRSLDIKEEINDRSGITISYNGLGSVYMDLGNYPEALKNLTASLKIAQAMDNKAEMSGAYCNLGIVYTRQRKFPEAEENLIKAMELSKEIGYTTHLKIVYKALSGLDSARGNYKGAYENHKLFIQYRDSLDNEETRKKTIQSQMTYDFEKKEAVAEAEHKKKLENQQALAEEKNRKQKIVLLLVFGSLILVLVFAAFVLKSLKITKKQKSIIEYQKLLVEEKQKEVLDSIYYASRIQHALLPTEKYIDRMLKRLKKRE
jgi:tetratricopeptide (TPR) repeat protein